MTYCLHITNKNYSSWSLRPWVLMRALGIPFTEQLHRFTPGTADDFRNVSPSGRVPWLVDGDTVSVSLSSIGTLTNRVVTRA